jgi:CheY-like chemotaxis protein
VAPVSAANAHVSSAGHETLLLVEDDELVRKIAERILSTSGYTVIVATDGREALAFSDQELADVDLVLTDVMMPNLNGVELARALLERRRDLPLVFMSGFTGHETELSDELTRLGPMLAKPFTSHSLLATVRRELDHPTVIPVSGT